MPKHNTKTQPVKHWQIKLTSERNTNKTGQSEKRKYRLAAATVRLSLWAQNNCPTQSKKRVHPKETDKHTHTHTLLEVHNDWLWVHREEREEGKPVGSKDALTRQDMHAKETPKIKSHSFFLLYKNETKRIKNGA